MTSVEYQQLVEFLGHQFTELDRRFDRLGWKVDLVTLQRWTTP